MSKEMMNKDGKNGVFIVGGWMVDLLENGEIDDLEVFLDRSDCIFLNIDFQQDYLKFVKKHTDHPNEYDIVLASNSKHYAVRYGTEEDFYSK